MKVLFFPYGRGNPYQSNLARALGEKGADIEFAGSSRLFTLLRMARGKHVLHLHWTAPYIIAPKITKSIRLAFSFFLTLIVLKMQGKKVIWTIHNLGEHERQHPVFELYCHRLLARLVDAIIAHSRYGGKRTAEAYWIGRKNHKIQIIPHGSYIENYLNTTSRVQARLTLGISAEKRVFLFLGSIRAYKGLPELVSAFCRISNGNELLVLAGKPLNDQIKVELGTLVEGRSDILYCPEFVPDEKIQLFMKAADVVVFPFRDIFTSGSILLAMSFGKAVVAPQLESLEEIIEVGGTIAYDPASSDGLEVALATSLSADLEKMGTRNLDAARKLNWEFIADETFQIYKNL